MSRVSAAAGARNWPADQPGAIFSRVRPARYRHVQFPHSRRAACVGTRCPQPRRWSNWTMTRPCAAWLAGTAAAFCPAEPVSAASATTDDGQLLVPAGFVAGLQVDPIEKKPLYHAFPGRDALSFGMLGCNFHCPFCQNWISTQTLRDDRAVVHPQMVDPQQLVSLAGRTRHPSYCQHLQRTAHHRRLGRRGLQARPPAEPGCAASSAMATPRPRSSSSSVHTWTSTRWDLKCFDEAGYRRLGGVMQNVLDTIRLLVKLDFWVEVVTLVVPGFKRQRRRTAADC